MALQVAALSIELIETLCPLVPRIKARDKSLAEIPSILSLEAWLGDNQ